jgi:hypothetical protein
VEKVPPYPDESGRITSEFGSRAKSAVEANVRMISEAEVQFLPPRLSAVLAQLRAARRQLVAGKRQNKVLYTFQQILQYRKTFIL